MHARLFRTPIVLALGYAAAFLAGACFCDAAFGQRLHEVIDREIEAAADGPVSPPADDGEFLRRAYLDLNGTLPTADQARAFLADKHAAKREKLIDRLLSSEHFPRRIEEALTTTLLERRIDKQVPDERWRGFLQQALAKNRPWDQIVSELIFSEPDKDKKPKPPGKFFLVAGRNDIHQRTQDVARLLLGRDMMCAQCHDHPTVEEYTQSDYFGLYSYLQETADKARSEFESVFVPGKNSTGPRLPGLPELEIPKFEKAQQEEAAKHRPRLLLAANLPTAENALFKRNAVNRFWFLLMGRGLVHPLDMHHAKNPPSHPKLLEALADEFANHKFDVKHLVREITLSKAYQRSSLLPAGVEPRDAPAKSFRAAVVKPLSPEQMAWAVLQASGNLEALRDAPPPKDSTFNYNDYINGRITQAPSNFRDVMKLFVGVFGNPPGEAEVEFNPAMGQALFLMNEPLILDRLKPHPGNLTERLMKLETPSAVAEELYLSVLTRMPSDEERAETDAYLKRFARRRAGALADLAWALLSSAEFRVNH